VQIKVRFPDFRTLTRSAKLSQPTQQTHTLYDVASQLLRETLPQPRMLRLLGVGVTQICDGDQPMQQSLFELQDTRQQSAMDQVSDAIKARFGAKAIRRAGP
jgi:DNA polymerase-4